jgi:sigma-B regulation protein RsbU (phosphoserine phosphatase)
LRLSEETVNLEKGDTVVAYTDGLTDIENNQGKDYGRRRLADTMNNAPARAPDVLSHILTDVEAFVGPAPQPDDLTLLILTSD